MLNEVLNIFRKVKSFRLLNEGVSDAGLVDAINNQEYLYIYYDGDDNVEKGYRTIRPYVLGNTSEGNTVLRAWQDKGRSQSLGVNATRPKRQNHEYWYDSDSSVKPGWRLFRVDKISKIYPIGKRFIDKNGNVLIPPKYKEGSDQQMAGGIIAYVSTKKATRDVVNADDIDKPKVTTKDASVFDKQSGRWKDFYNVNKSGRDISPDNVSKLYDIAKNVYKKSPTNMFIAIDKNNRYSLKDEKIKNKFPREAIVGNLRDLYDELVLNNRQKSAFEIDFINKEKNKTFLK